jgi:AraC-like DNA-binding protein
MKGLHENLALADNKQLPYVLWIGLKYKENTNHTHMNLQDVCQLEFVRKIDEIEDAIRKFEPGVLCFDFDIPTQGGFNALREIKAKYPSLPILVITEDSSIEWAVLALRLRVWDYFIKPFSSTKLENTIELLLQSPTGQQRQRNNFMSQPSIPKELHSEAKINRLSSRMSIATTYVRQQLHTKVSLEEVAKSCGMSKSHFSRSFKSILGIAFQEYLSQQRIEKALTLLKNSDLAITEVALSSGFPEISNFSTTFQRHIGMRPSCFRKALVLQSAIDHGAETLSNQFPSMNPSPVLSYELNGRAQFINPAAVHLLRELHLKNVDGILPSNHSTLLKDCIETGNPCTEKREVAGRTFVWSYHPMLMADVVFVFGYDVSEFAPADTESENFPSANPNPVLASDVNGALQFVNPATKQIIEELNVESVDGLLPQRHGKLVTACIKSNTPLTENRVFPTKTIVWSYQPISDRGLIYIYGHCVES